MILVTGAAGFIASNLCHYLTSLGNDVIGVDAMLTGSSINNLYDIDEDKFQLINADLREYEVIEDIFRRYPIHQVYHLAAESHVDRSITGDLPFWTSNVIGTRNLLKLCQKFSVYRVLNQITDEVFGPKEFGQSFEGDVFLPTSPYAASKAAQYYVGHSYSETYNLPVVSTFPANTYGPRQYTEKLIPKFISKLHKGEKVPLMASTHFERDWLAVTDHVEALVVVMEHGFVGRGYNIPGAGCLTNREVTGTLLELMHKTWDKNVDIVDDRKAHDCRYCVSGSKIAALGWRPKTKLLDYLPAVVEWYTGANNGN